MGIFGRSRAHTTNQISQPVLTFSDAAPREDLQALRPAHSPRPYTAKAGRSVDGRGRQNVTQGFDFTVTEPHEDPSTSDPSSLNDHGVDANAIGIALGSPSMAPPPQNPPPSAPEKQEMTTSTGLLRRKPSKWKKFGGLLKSRQPETKRTREGFYQLDVETVENEKVSSSQHLINQTEVPAPSQKRNAKPTPPKDQRHGRKIDNHHADAESSLLKVDIPPVEMERYSIMFGSVLGEKPSSNLLSRRSKALDQLHVHGGEPKRPQTYKPHRRGTSPGTCRSPVFPGASGGEMTDKNIDSNHLAPRSPIRSNTFPRAAALSRNNHKRHLAVPDLTPALSTGTSFDYSSAEPSPSSFESPVIIKSQIDGGRPEPVWEMVTKPSSSIPLETSYTTRPNTKSPPLLRMGSVEQPKSATVTPRNKVETEEDDKLLLDQPSAPQHPHQLSRSHTMPLPLKIKKNKSEIQTKASAATTTTTTPTDSDDSPIAKTIEISIARSVSVTRRVPKQTLVPLGATPQAFHNENERFGEHQKLLPTLVDVGGGEYSGVHRHQKSQDIIIETI
ncbi:hypothetical protein UA08_02188 [Talaromyces atroroseus]|uniref:Uncharacterized protein n=1 Tax=Talaromyces atroroseus TaxID=1441469 RepID=A0A225AKR2_TALAT|nr:hypothetical protein UA08_02188 [Talaromyces atroroseus]OKL62122.1 hypothetical protein UA08_02188 [Talaromyces atroroseus]